MGMSMRQPRVTRCCPVCGTLHQSNHTEYCSILCEDGRREPPISHPESPQYYLHLKGNPEDAVGKYLVTECYKYSDRVQESWHKSPEQLDTVWLSEDETEMVYKSSTVVGKITMYGKGEYTLIDDLDSGAIIEKRINASDVVKMLREETWWLE